MSPTFLVSLSMVFFSWMISPEPAHAAKPQPRYACVAALECENAGAKIPLDLPSDDTTIVRAENSESAKADCQRNYESAYASLQKTAPAGCTVSSNVYRVKRTPASRR